MDRYIGCKLVSAEPQTKPTGEQGYYVMYADSYTSWSPKEVFEQSYLKVQDNPKLPSGVSIGPDMIDAFIKGIEVSTLGEKTTLVRCTLVNDFELIESSACVDVANYDEELGAQICMKKIEDKIWFLLGFLLQTAYKGVKV